MAAIAGSLSGPDEILVSSTIQLQLALDERDDVHLVDRGEHELKGIAAPQRVFALVAAEDALASLA